MTHVETVIVGAGPAGLATSYHLSRHGREHLVLEQAPHPANAWREGRWDSFTLVTPNWALKLPGAEYDGSDPDGFMPRADVIAYFDQYVERFRLPVRCNTRVTSITARDPRDYRVDTPDGPIDTANVVVATGLHQQPKVPSFAANFSPRVTQLPSSRYRNPGALPGGAVLVVGSAQSGCQIAEELYLSGRTVYLSTGRAGRIPRRYRGADIIRWLDQVGLFDLTPEQLPPGMSKFGGIPHFSGTKGGHTLNLHQFAHDGVTLLGHLRDATGTTVSFAPDHHENLAAADAFEREAANAIDGYIDANGLTAPVETLPDMRAGFDQPAITELDLAASGIGTIIWAMGFTFDYSFVHLPVHDADGFPIQTRGVTRHPGLYFVGMPWMPTERSGFLLGVGTSAAHIASTIAAPSRPSA